MTNKMYETLEFDKILGILEDHALSEKARERIRRLEPCLSETAVRKNLNETTEARTIIEHSGNPPLSPMNELDKIFSALGKGIMLMPEQLGLVAQFLTACRRLKAYMKKAESTGTAAAYNGNSINDLSDLEDEINSAIRGSQVDDKASPLLSDIRRKISNGGEQLKSKLDSLLRNNPNWFSEAFVSSRNGHYTLPVKREFKNQVKGAVIDVSQSGGTYFIEPAAAARLQDELALLRIEEENEVRRILYALTALVEESLSLININIEAMEYLDFIFAKAKLSLVMKAVPLPVTVERSIEIRSGRHPLLKPETAVPLDFKIGGGIRGVVVTGPNTGGKTVALKTVGLLSLMAQSGLHVPAEDGHFSMNNYVLCDIGDGQSITENLSTFSSHITNIIRILKTADEQSLVLLDELGSGTDPAEGMGLAAAILEELSGKGCLFIATTHYPEIKEFASSRPGMINARMAFDRQSLLPLYRLEIGEAGESCALYIAKRLGLSQRLIQRASEYAYGNDAGKLKKSMSGEGPGNRTLSMLNTIDSALSEQHSCAEQQPGVEQYSGTEQQPDEEQPLRRIKAAEPLKPAETPRSMRFNIGDSVMIYPQKLIGIVYMKANEKGDIGVQLKNKKLLINHKRLKLHVPVNELYPDNYDFSIIFDSVAVRKARHKMGRSHDPKLVLEFEGEERH